MTIRYPRLLVPSPRAIAFAVGLLVSTQLAFAQGVDAASSPTFRISGFELTGDIPLSSEDTTRVLAPFISNQATIETLQKASAALEQALQAKGFALHRVALPPQEVGEKVTLNVVKFVIGKVVLEGAQYHSEQNIRASIPELQEGQAPSFSKLAVQMALANENPSKQLQVNLKESETPDTIDVRVSVKDSPALTGSLNWNNTGTNATGNDRATVAFNHNNVRGLDHQMSAALTTSLERSDLVKQLGLNYRIPFYRDGEVLGLAYTYSDVIGNFGSFQSTGAGQTLGLNYSHYFAPEGGLRTYLSGGLDYKLYNAAKVNGVVVSGQVDRVSTPITLGYTARKESDTAMWLASVELATNLGGGAGASLTDYKTEDGRIQTTNWTALRVSANYVAPFASDWTWSVRSQMQYSGDALISGEQFGLGGSNSVRGTSERVVSGDNGVFVSLEIQTPQLAPGLRLLGFVDGGELTNNNSAASTALKPGSDQVASVGFGLRWNTAVYSLVADFGQIVTAAKQPAGGNNLLPKAGDSKLHVNLTARF